MERTTFAILMLPLLWLQVSAQWVTTPTGPSTVSAVAVTADGMGGSIVFAGTSSLEGFSGQGVFVSTDSGSTWGPANTGLTNTNIRALAVTGNASGGTTIFAGAAGEGNYGDVNGVYISTDNGAHWGTVNNGAMTSQTVVSALAVSPSDVDGTYLFAGTYHSGVLRSTDNGASWSSVCNGLPKTDATNYYDVDALAAGPDGTGGMILLVGTYGAGIFISTDGGANWKAANNYSTGIPDLYIRTLAVSPRPNGTVDLFAGGGLLYRSTDLGASWVSANYSGITGVNAILVDSSRVFAGVGIGSNYDGYVLHSTDGGANWTLADNNWPIGTHVSALACMHDGAKTTRVYAGTTYGVFISSDGGTAWNSLLTSLRNLYIRSFPSGLDQTTGSNICALTDHGIVQSTDNGTCWQSVAFPERLLPWVLAVSPRAGPTGSTNLLAGTIEGKFFLSTDNGESWTQTGGVLSPDGFVWDGTKLYCWSDAYITVSTNNGGNWTWVTTSDHIYPYCSITGLLVVPNGTGGTNLFIQTYPQGPYLSTDNGANWNISTGGLPARLATSVICPNGAGGLNVFVGAGDASTGVFLSTDRGMSWNAVNNGLPAPCVVKSLAYYPNTTGGANLFAWSHGFYLSSSNGTSWVSHNERLLNIGYDGLIAVGPESGGGRNLFLGAFGIWHRPLSDLVTSVSTPQQHVPAVFALEQNFPNPFNPITTITYTLPYASHVTLTVYDIVGREVSLLSDEQRQAGTHTARFDASELSSGLYFYRIRAGEFIQTRRMIVVK